MILIRRTSRRILAAVCLLGPVGCGAPRGELPNVATDAGPVRRETPPSDDVWRPYVPLRCRNLDESRPSGPLRN